MTLTTVIGSSGSGKTTFLNDVYKSHKCIYIRQYHNMRPYMIVSKLPNFDPTQLPYWNVYVNEGKDKTIQIGGTMGGVYTAGLSGGQRKLLLFEMIYQRIVNHKKDLLVVLDEPFAGVTDDFVPFIIQRLQILRQHHNILIVTNDHVKTLTSMADNTITVSAINRNHVQINNNHEHSIEREKVILALSLGDNYTYSESNIDDLKFFINVEVIQNNIIIGIIIFTLIAYALIIVAFWDSNENMISLIIVGASMIAFFCANPYVLSLVEWRNAMKEESEALVHSSKSMNKLLKTIITLFIIFIISIIEYCSIIVIVSDFNTIQYFIAILFDNASILFPLIALGIYTTIPFELTQLLGSLPFLCMLFFSTTFSPGSGIPGIKALRYLFPRFYFWCILPDVQDTMEGCPNNNTMNTIYLILSSFVGVLIFIIIKSITTIRKMKRKHATKMKHNSMKESDAEFIELQNELYGKEKLLHRFNHNNDSIISTSSSDTSSYDDDNNNRNHNDSTDTTNDPYLEGDFIHV